MKVKRIVFVLAAAGWVWVGAASARDTKLMKVDRNAVRPVVRDTTVDAVAGLYDGGGWGGFGECEMTCRQNAEQVFRDCREPADGTPSGTWEECLAKAHEFLEVCLRDECSLVPSCMEVCREQAEAAFNECRAEPRNGSWEECAREAHAAFETCVAANCPPPPPPPPTCEDACKNRAREFFQTCVSDCVTAGGTEEHCREACGPQAREQLRTCLETECGIVPSCEEVCTRQAGECLAGGGDPAECRLALEACLADVCGHVPSCEEQCRELGAEVFRSCRAEVPDPGLTECGLRAHAAVETCLRDQCGYVPSCEEECRMAAANAFRDCFMQPSATIEACAMAAMQAMQTCLANCGVPPTCEDVCRRDAAAAAAECMQLPFPEIPACFARVEENLHACLANCPPP